MSVPLDEDGCRRLLRAVFGVPEPPPPGDIPAGRKDGLRLIEGGAGDEENGEEGDGGE